MDVALESKNYSKHAVTLQHIKHMSLRLSGMVQTLAFCIAMSCWHLISCCLWAASTVLFCRYQHIFRAEALLISSSWTLLVSQLPTLLSRKFVLANNITWLNMCLYRCALGGLRLWAISLHGKKKGSLFPQSRDGECANLTTLRLKK